MAARISITTSRENQSQAASFLSEELTKLQCPHAYIGGFAWSCLGSTRPTEISFSSTSISLSSSDSSDSSYIIYDIDVLIDTKNLDMRALRQHLESHMQFAQAALKLYYIPEQIGDLRDEELLYTSKNNVLIDTLQAGKLGLPTPEPVYEIVTDSGQTIRILHPSVLILTKLKRWSHNYELTRPKTILKNKSDQKDINYMLNWLVYNGMTMAFEEYKGKTREELLVYVRNYGNKFRDDLELMKVLESAMKPDDWNAL